ncbi:MAG TPA: hypothetical protein VF131_01800 [Blastocatellia bacterium]|nr:hypothetical protein [Blastocatellia bacterium]
MKLLMIGRLCLVIGIFLLTLMTAGSQMGRAPAPVDGVKQEPRFKKISIDSINGESIDPHNGVVIDTFHEGRKLPVVASGEIGADDNVWLLISALDSPTYHVYGPGKQQQKMDQINWILPDVTLPYPSDGQTRRFVFHAAILPKDRVPDEAVDSLKDFPVVSWPLVQVAVLKWVPRAGALSIDSVGGKEVDPGVPMQVDATAEVAGTKPQESKERIYLILHPVNSELWRVVGEAEERSEKGWRCRDIAFTEPGQPHWRHVDLFAIQTAETLQPGPIDYKDYVKRIQVSSPSVRIWVKDDEVIPSKKSAKVELARYVTPDGQVRNLGPGQQGVVKLNDLEISLQGTVKDLPQGKALKALLNPVGTPMWIVQEGSALISETKTVQEGTTTFSITEWNLPRLRIESPGDVSAKRFRLVIGVADRSLKSGVVSYGNWQSQCVGASPLMTIEVEGKADEQPLSSTEITLSIVRVAGVEVDSSNEVKVASRGPVVVQAEGVPAQAQVWVGKNHSDQDSWRFVPATRMPDDTWVAEGMSFGGKSAHSNNPGSPDSEETLTAIVSRTSLSAHDSDAASWPLYAWAVSPRVKVVHPPTLSESIGAILASPPAWLIPLVVILVLLTLALLTARLLRRAPFAGAGAGEVGGASSAPAPGQAQAPLRPADRSTRELPVWLFGAILMLGLFFMMGNSLFYFLLPLLILILLLRLGRNSQMTRVAAGEVRKASEAVLTSIQGQLQGVPKPHAVRSILGLLLLGLGLFAIVGYFPIYEHILQSTLRLSRQQSHSLGLLLIIFIGLTGVMADITARYGRAGEAESSNSGDEKPAQDKGQFIYYLSMTLIVMIAAALLWFQYTLYREFYETHAAEGSRIPAAFGAAALFIAGIEMVNFYWASRLALDFIVWFFVNVFLIGPPALLARAASIVEQGSINSPDKTPREGPVDGSIPSPRGESFTDEAAKETDD